MDVSCVGSALLKSVLTEVHLQNEFAPHITKIRQYEWWRTFVFRRTESWSNDVQSSNILDAMGHGGYWRSVEVDESSSWAVKRLAREFTPGSPRLD